MALFSASPNFIFLRFCSILGRRQKKRPPIQSSRVRVPERVEDRSPVEHHVADESVEAQAVAAFPRRLEYPRAPILSQNLS